MALLTVVAAVAAAFIRNRPQLLENCSGSPSK
jgi:hypothetical protein